MESNQPLVSVVMNCYNGEKYLKEAIDSIMTQTYQNWEIIFWDNQSTDKSANIVTLYNDKRIKYFYAPSHTPLGEARNLALSECCGEYIGFLDTDDIWIPQKLEKQLKMMETNKQFMLCYGDFEKIAEDGTQITNYNTKHTNGYIFPELLKWYDIGMLTAMIRSAVLSENSLLIFDTTLRFSPDYDLFMRVAAKYEVCSIKERIAKYRLTDGSLSEQTKDRHAKELLCSLEKLEKLYPSLRQEYQKEFTAAYRWGAIMEANYLLSIGDIGAARVYLRQARSAGGKHRLRYIVSLLPVFIAMPIYKKYFDIG